MSISQMQPETSWNLEHNFLVHNMFTHLNQNFMNNPEDVVQLLNYSSTYIKHISEKLTQYKIPHQVLMLEHPDMGECCAILDCGGSFWSTIGKDIESVFNYMGIKEDEQKLFSLYPKTINKEHTLLISESIKEDFPEILIAEAPIYQPIIWKQVSFLELKFTSPLQNTYREASFIIKSETPNLLLHEQKPLQKENLNVMAQEAIEFSPKKPIDEFYTNIAGENHLKNINVEHIKNALLDSHQNIKKLYNEYRLFYKNSERPQQWTTYLMQKLSQLAESVIELKGNESNSFLIEEFSELGFHVKKHQTLQLEIDTIEKEKILLDIVTLGLLGNKPIKQSSEGNQFYYIPLKSFANPYFIHSKKESYIYAYSNPKLDSVLEKMNKININNDDDMNNWYTLDQHPFSNYLVKYLKQMDINTKISPNSVKIKPKNRF